MPRWTSRMPIKHQIKKPFSNASAWQFLWQCKERRSKESVRGCLVIGVFMSHRTTYCYSGPHDTISYKHFYTNCWIDPTTLASSARSFLPRRAKNNLPSGECHSLTPYLPAWVPAAINTRGKSSCLVAFMKGKRTIFNYNMTSSLWICVGMIILVRPSCQWRISKDYCMPGLPLSRE